MLVRWNPFEEMNTLFKDMDRLFRRTWSEGAITPFGEGTRHVLPSSMGGRIRAFTPAVEVYQKDNNLVLRAELPGVKPEDVDVNIIGNQLHLRGERKQNQEINENNYFVSESSYGQFERAFTLPEGIKPEDVKASYKDGILEIKLPAKGLAQQTHKVKIEGAPEEKKLSKSAA